MHGLLLPVIQSQLGTSPLILGAQAASLHLVLGAVCESSNRARKPIAKDLAALAWGFSCSALVLTWHLLGVRWLVSCMAI